MLRIAIQKKGRLSEKSLELLAKAGIKINGGSRLLVAKAKDFPVEFLFLRDDDIPEYVQDGVADIGIVGENEMLEKQKNTTVVKRLGFARCRMSLAVPKTIEIENENWFNGKRIATSYPGILNKYLKEKGLKAEIHEIGGSVEIATGIGLSDAIFDIVSSGSTLISNGLTEVIKVIDSEAVLIGGKKLSNEKQGILDELIFRLNAVQAAESNKYILLNAPNDKLDEIIKLIPGMKSPTILPLAEEGWSSVHSVVNENKFWDVIGKLRTLGAKGLLVIPIEKMVV